MQQRFDAGQLSKVLDQALIYQCACPAQVCRALFELRDLHEYQLNCGADTANDRAVHDAIADSTERAHQAMEDCLARVLEIEGWNMTTLVMPEGLRKKTVKPL